MVHTEIFFTKPDGTMGHTITAEGRTLDEAFDAAYDAALRPEVVTVRVRGNGCYTTIKEPTK